jgi:hypothetical protein
MPEETIVTSDPKNRKERREQQRNAAPRQNNPRPRRKAEDVINNLPAPWAGKVIELSTDLTARKRLALLALRGEYGYKVLLFVRINAVRTTQTEAGMVEAVEAFDILPQDVVAASAEANLLGDDIIVKLSEELADFAEKQAAWQRPEARPLAHRPLQRLASLAAVLQRQEAPAPVRKQDVEQDDGIRQICNEVLSLLPAPRPTVRKDDAWWWASCV